MAKRGLARNRLQVGRFKGNLNARALQVLLAQSPRHFVRKHGYAAADFTFGGQIAPKRRSMADGFAFRSVAVKADG